MQMTSISAVDVSSHGDTIFISGVWGDVVEIADGEDVILYRERNQWIMVQADCNYNEYLDAGTKGYALTEDAIEPRVFMRALQGYPLERGTWLHPAIHDLPIWVHSASSAPIRQVRLTEHCPGEGWEPMTPEVFQALNGKCLMHKKGHTFVLLSRRERDGA